MSPALMSILSVLPPSVLQKLLTLYARVNRRLRPYSKLQILLIGAVFPTFLRAFRLIEFVDRLARDVFHLSFSALLSNQSKSKASQSSSESTENSLVHSYSNSSNTPGPGPSRLRRRLQILLHHYLAEFRSALGARSVWLLKTYGPNSVQKKLTAEKRKMMSQFEKEMGGGPTSHSIGHLLTG